MTEAAVCRCVVLTLKVSLTSSPLASSFCPPLFCLFFFWSLHPDSLCVFPPPPPPPPGLHDLQTKVIFNAFTDMLYVRRSVRVLQRFARTHPLACALCQQCLTSFGPLLSFTRKIPERVRMLIWNLTLYLLFFQCKKSFYSLKSQIKSPIACINALVPQF